MGKFSFHRPLGREVSVALTEPGGPKQEAGERPDKPLRSQSGAQMGRWEGSGGNAVQHSRDSKSSRRDPAGKAPLLKPCSQEGTCAGVSAPLRCPGMPLAPSSVLSAGGRGHQLSRMTLVLPQGTFPGLMRNSVWDGKEGPSPLVCKQDPEEATPETQIIS